MEYFTDASSISESMEVFGIFAETAVEPRCNRCTFLVFFTEMRFQGSLLNVIKKLE